MVNNSSSRQKVIQSSKKDVAANTTMINSSLVNSEYGKRSSISSVTKKADGKMPLESMKVHRGPLNLNAITMRDPNTVYNDIIRILNDLGVSNKRSVNFSVKCEYKELKFMIEINFVEKFNNIFVIKFYKNNQAHTNYFELCSTIFSKLNL